MLPAGPKSVLTAYGDNDVMWETTLINDEAFLARVAGSVLREPLSTLTHENLCRNGELVVAHGLLPWFQKSVLSARFFFYGEGLDRHAQRHRWDGSFTLPARLEGLAGHVGRWTMDEAVFGTLTLRITIVGTEASVHFLFQSQTHRASRKEPEDVDTVEVKWEDRPNLDVPLYRPVL